MLTAKVLQRHASPLPHVERHTAAGLHRVGPGRTGRPALMWPWRPNLPARSGAHSARQLSRRARAPRRAPATDPERRLANPAAAARYLTTAGQTLPTCVAQPDPRSRRALRAARRAREPPPAPAAAGRLSRLGRAAGQAAGRAAALPSATTLPSSAAPLAPGACRSTRLPRTHPGCSLSRPSPALASPRRPSLASAGAGAPLRAHSARCCALRPRSLSLLASRSMRLPLAAAPLRAHSARCCALRPRSLSLLASRSMRLPLVCGGVPPPAIADLS